MFFNPISHNKLLTKLWTSLLVFCLVTPHVLAKDTALQSFQLMISNAKATTRTVIATPKHYKNNLTELLTPPSDPTEPVHIVVPVNQSVSMVTWQNAFTRFKNFKTEVVLSLVPEKNMAHEAYIEVLKNFYNLNSKVSASNIYLIAYPQTLENLSSYAIPEVTGIGLDYRGSQDQPFLEKIYATFAETKPIFVHDLMTLHYDTNTSEGLMALNAFYYNVALNYPKLHTIFYDFKELQTTSPYYKFYNQLLKEPWISPTSPVAFKDSLTHGEVHLSEAYIPLTEYMTFDKASKLLVQVKSPSASSIHCIQYSLNNEVIDYNFTAPFILSLDASLLYNGVGRLEAKAFNASGKLLWSSTQDLLLEGRAISDRAPRQTPSYNLEQKPSYPNQTLPVLMYHVFSEETEPASPFITVGIKRFEEQIQALLANGYTPITFKDLDAYLKGEGGLPDKPIILTADDGYLNNYTLAFPILQKYKVPATFFVSPGIVGVDTGNLHFTWEEAREMEESGLIDIQIHGYNHTPFTLLTTKDVYYQVSCAWGVIEKYLGKRDLVAVSYPEFRHTKEMQDLLTQMGISFQTTDTKSTTTINRQDIKRINVPHSMTAEKLLEAVKAVSQ